MSRPRLLYRLGRITGVKAVSSTLGSWGLGEFRRITPTTGTGLDTDAGLCAGEAGGASWGSSGRDVPWIATGPGVAARFCAGASAALMKSSEVTLSEAANSARVGCAGAVELLACRLW